MVKLLKMGIKSYIPSKVKKIAKILLNQENKPLDLRKITDNPIEAIYLAKNKPFIINAEIIRCRSSFYQGLAFDENHPAVKTVKLVSNNSEGRKKSNLPLLDYYNNWQPKNAAQVLGFKRCGSNLEKLRPEEFVYPWDHIKPKEAGNIRKKKIDRYYKMGVVKDTEFGPMDKQKIEMELLRYTKLYKSISNKGYLVDKDHIESFLLTNSMGEYVFFIRGGQHRMSILSAMGYKYVSVIVSQIIRKDDVCYLPHVKNGLFSYNEAKYIFDRINDGKENKLVNIIS
ncbi:hypothetical protein QLX67_06735 [Balneolaceae bacterium ANBcel3]|nr:hypothetical protein [Balneolaceae bacterium ANBcel3]